MQCLGGTGQGEKKLISLKGKGIIPSEGLVDSHFGPFKVFFLFTALYLLVTPFRDLYGLEARNALFAKEMLGTGLTLIPKVMGKPYPDYPPLYFWLEYIFSLPFQKVTTFSAVLPSALSGAALLVVTFFLGQRISPRSGFWAAIILGTLPEFWLKASKATIDMLLALEITLAVFFLFMALYEKSDRRAFWLQALAFICVFFAFFTKGPIGIVLPFGVWTTFLLLQKGVRKALSFGLKAVLVSSICLAAEAWCVWREGGLAFLHEVMESQVLRRIGRESDTSIFYYPFYLLKTAGPWLLCLIPALAQWKKAISGRGRAGHVRDLIPDHPVIRLALVWFAVVFTIFSLASTKHGRYLLPLFPAMALILATVIEKALLYLDNKWIRRILLGLCLLIFSAAWGIYVYNPYGYRISPAWIIVWNAVYLLAGFALFRTRGRQETLAVAMAVLFALGLSGMQLVIEPGLSTVESGRPFVQSVESMVSSDASVVLYGIDDDRDGVKYALYSSRPSSQLVFVETEGELVGISPPFIVVTKKKKLEEIRPFLERSKASFLVNGLIHQRPVVAYWVRS